MLTRESSDLSDVTYENLHESFLLSAARYSYQSRHQLICFYSKIIHDQKII